jgi:succinate dehydrogenase/fumarate reductase flavoprotein subunit
VAAKARELAAFVDRGSAPEIPIHEFEYKVRRIINDYVVPPKNEWKLKNAISWMHRFREELGRLVQVKDAHELSRLIEVGFIIDCAELSATASLARRESRWLPRHYRTDYPETDDAG